MSCDGMKPLGVVAEAQVRQAEQAAVDEQHDDADAQQAADQPRCSRAVAQLKPALKPRKNQPQQPVQRPADEPAGHHPADDRGHRQQPR